MSIAIDQAIANEILGEEQHWIFHRGDSNRNKIVLGRTCWAAEGISRDLYVQGGCLTLTGDASATFTIYIDGAVKRLPDSASNLLRKSLAAALEDFKCDLQKQMESLDKALLLNK